MRTSLWMRVGASSGALAVVLNAAGAMLGDPYRSGYSPDPTDPSDRIAEIVVEIRDEARIGAALALVGAFFLIWFAAYLRHYLDHFERDGWMSSAAFGGGLVGAAVLLVSVSITLAATEITTYGDDTVIAKAFFTQGWNYFYIVSPPLLVLVVATSVIALRFRALPRWLGILGLIVALMPFVSGAGFGALIALLWILIASITLTIKGQPGPTQLENTRRQKAPKGPESLES